jgi:hypothetical protein
VSDCGTGGNIDHAKILSEVLKKYPNLVKNSSKNIKLKIMQKPSQSNSQTTAIVRVIKQDSNVTPAPNRTTPSNQPKKIDAKTMHELIKMGAENMKGPWLCLECGSGGRPISIPTYKKFRAHLINIHKQKIDPRICEYCGLKPARRIELVQHQLIAHEINPPPDVPLFRCSTKSCVFVTQKEELLMKHKREIHKEFQQKCRYCSKVFNKEFLLHAHMRAVHRHMAKNDGVMDFSEDEEYEPAGSSKGNQFTVIDEKKSNKIEILSNIEIPVSETINIANAVVSQPSSEAESFTNVATGIATSLALVDDVVMEDQFNIEQQLAQVHGEYEEPKKEDDSSGIITRLVAEDGTELELTAAQKEEILQQLQQQGATLSDNVVMVLDQRQLNVGEDNNGIMVVFSEGQDAVPNTNTLTTVSSNISTINAEELEKAEIVFQDDADKEKLNDSGKSLKSRLIADLEGDWAEDEPQAEEVKNEVEEEAREEEVKPTSQEKETTPVPESTQVTEPLSFENETEKKDESQPIKDILNDWDEEVKTDIKDEIEEAEKEVEKKSESEKLAEDEAPKVEPEEESVTSKLEVKEQVAVEEANEEVQEEEGKPSEKSKIITDLLDEWNDL